MKLRGIRRTALALVLGVGALITLWGAGQHSIASAPSRQGLAGESMPPVPMAITNGGGETFTYYSTYYEDND